MTTPGHWTPDTFCRYIDGSLSGDEAATLCSHLDGCLACQQELESQQAARRWLTRRPPIEMPLQVRRRIQERLRRPAPTATKRWLWSGVLAAGMAAAAVFSVWPSPNALPLDALLAAHARYGAESTTSPRDYSVHSFTWHVDRFEAVAD